jgi:hypothetical protein
MAAKKEGQNAPRYLPVNQLHAERQAVYLAAEG